MSVPPIHRDMSVFLRIGSRFARKPAQSNRHLVNGFAISEKPVSILDVATGSVPARSVTCQYRYPSPIGRSGFPKTRPSALFPENPRQVSDIRRFSAVCEIVSELIHASRVSPGTCINRGVTEQCGKQNSSQWQLLDLPVSRPVVTRSANRHWSAAVPGSARRLSRVAMSVRAPSSALRPTSHIARPIRALAAPSTDLNTTRRGLPTGNDFAEPRVGTPGAGFLRLRSIPVRRAQEPGRT